MLTLYQFPFSHYCEKARWALDYKGIAYTPRNLLPGPHLRVTRKLAPRSSVPILVDGDTVVQDSKNIIDFLEQRSPLPSLTPTHPERRSQALEWEAYLDREIGVPLRAWFYFHLLPQRRRAIAFWTQGGPRYGRLLYAFIFPVVRRATRRMLQIEPEHAARCEQRWLAALQRLNETVALRRFLVEGGFSRADLTAAALLSPLWNEGLPTASLRELWPEPVLALREARLGDPALLWVAGLYRDFRKPAARQS